MYFSVIKQSENCRTTRKEKYVVVWNQLLQTRSIFEARVGIADTIFWIPVCKTYRVYGGILFHNFAVEYLKPPLLGVLCIYNKGKIK